MINLPKLLARVETILDKHQAQYEQETARQGKAYVIKTEDARMEISITESWIGYVLSVPAADIGNLEDTDNYGLNDDNYEISMEIFKEVTAALEGLLSQKVYVGVIGKKKALAIPAPGGDYKLITVQKAFIGHYIEKEEMSVPEILSIQGLRVVH